MSTSLPPEAPAAAAPRLRIQILGEAKYHLDGVRIDPEMGMRARELVAYLAVYPHQAHRREKLTDVLWPEKTSDRGGANLRRALFLLRSALGEAADLILDVSDTTIGLRPDDTWVDYHALQARLKANEAGELEAGVEALDLVTGDLLGEAPPDWVYLPRETLRRRVIGAGLRSVAWLRGLGQLDAAATVCRRVLEVDPLDESANALLVMLLGESGDRSGALAHYALGRDLLERELSVRPSPELDAAFHFVLQLAPPINPIAPTVSDSASSSTATAFHGARASASGTHDTDARAANGRTSASLASHGDAAGIGLAASPLHMRVEPSPFSVRPPVESSALTPTSAFNGPAGFAQTGTLPTIQTASGGVPSLPAPHLSTWHNLTLLARWVAIAMLVFGGWNALSHRWEGAMRTADELVGEHELASRMEELPVQSADPKLVDAWFGTHVPYRVESAPGGPDGYVLHGGGLCDLAGEKAATTVYYGENGSRISVFKFPEGDLPLPVNGAAQFGSMYGLRRDGHSIVFWTEHGLVYAVVSELELSHLTAVAGQLAGS